LVAHNKKEMIPFRIGKWAKKLSFLVTFRMAVMVLSVSCNTQTPFDSLADSVYQSSGASGMGKMQSFVFTAALSGGELTADKNVSINEGNLLTTFVTSIHTELIVPTILFCGDSSCATGKTADELGIHYKPRYRAADLSFYSCPAPIPGRDYDKTTGWFETAVAAGWCTKEDRSKIFKEPTVYTITGSDGSIQSYRFTANFVAGTAKDMTELSFLQSKNPALSADVKKTISTHPSAVSVTLPFGVDKASLVPTFSITGSKVTHTNEGGAEIVSSSTAVDFTTAVHFFVVEADGAGGHAYPVTVLTQNPLNEFKLETSKNPGLSRDYTGTIDHTAKTVSFAFDAGENASARIPTIDVTDSSITVSPSGDSAQNFGSALTYRFTSSSGSFADYTVSATHSPNPGEIIITEIHYDVDISKGFEGAGGTTCTESDDEFIEIYNASSTSFNLAGMSFQYGTSGGNFSKEYTFPSYTLGAGEYLVVVSKDAGCYTTASLAGKKVLFDTAAWALSSSGATFALVLDATDLPDSQTGPAINEGTTTVIDYVGTDSGAKVYQAGKASDCADKTSARNGITNTNNNANDFTCGIANGSPGRANP